MKKFIYLILLISSTVIAQTSSNKEIILKTNGEEMIGKTNSISAEVVGFVYQNESIAYHVNTSDIVKITFSSGRIQFFNKFDSKDKPEAKLADHHNKVAVLPFGFIKDQMDGSDAMSTKIQQETFTVFNVHRGGLEFKSPNNTNALLIKAGVHNNNIQ